MKKRKLNIYLAAFSSELSTGDGIERICTALGNPDGTESDAYGWIEEGRTEKEIITLLRKMGYDIPKGITGSDEIKFDCTIQD